MKSVFFVQRKEKLQLATLFSIPIRMPVHNPGLFKQIMRWLGHDLALYVKSYISGIQKMKSAFFVQRKQMLQLATLFAISIRMPVHNTSAFKQTMRWLDHDLALLD